MTDRSIPIDLTRRSVAAGLAITPLMTRSLYANAKETDLSFLDGGKLIEAYGKQEFSPPDVVDAIFKRVDPINKAVNAFVFLDQQGAMRAAEASAARWKTGKQLGPLDGVPVTVKDNIAWGGHPTRKGSRTSSDAPSAESAPSVSRLLASGTVVIGKTCMPEFGWKGVGDSPLTGITRNPWNLKVTTGGSTAGGAASSVLGIGVAHLGTDGAGSLRIPSSFCGTFGFKPSYGRIPVVPAAPTLHLGSVSRTVRDTAVMLKVLAGPDPRDFLSQAAPLPDILGSLEAGVGNLRIAWSPRLGYVEHLDPEVESITTRAANAFAALGAKVGQADPGFANPMPILQPIWLTIAWGAVRSIPESRWREVDPGLLALAMKGRNVSGADFAAGLSARAVLHATLELFFEKHDILLTPTVATPAFQVGHDTPPDGSFGDDWLNWAPYTYPFNLSRHPAASVPCGFTRDGRPVGLQIVGPYLREDLVLRAARAFEHAHPWPFLENPKA